MSLSIFCSWIPISGLQGLSVHPQIERVLLQLEYQYFTSYDCLFFIWWHLIHLFCKILQVWPRETGITVILQIQNWLGRNSAIFLHTHGFLYANKWQDTTYHIRTISWHLIMFLKPKSCTYYVPTVQCDERNCKFKFP